MFWNLKCISKCKLECILFEKKIISCYFLFVLVSSSNFIYFLIFFLQYLYKCKACWILEKNTSFLEIHKLNKQNLCSVEYRYSKFSWTKRWLVKRIQKRGIGRKLAIWTYFCLDVLSPFFPGFGLSLDPCKPLCWLITQNLVFQGWI